MSDKSNRIRQSSFRSGNNINIGSGHINMSGGSSLGSSVNGIIQRVYSSKNQSLQEVMAKIQSLLKQLDEANPMATKDEKIAIVNLATPTKMKQQAVDALAGKDQNFLLGFLDSLDTPEAKAVALSTIEGWLRGI